MSAGTADAGLESPPLGGLLSRLRGLLSPRTSAGEELGWDTPLSQLLVRAQWRSSSRTHPERSKVLGLVQAELSESSRLLARNDARDAAAEHELKALLLEHARIRTVDDGWELVARLKRLNLRLGRCDRAYVQS